MRWVLGVLVGGLLLAGVAGGVVYAALQPPAPLAQPEPGVTLDGVTWINPGLERHADARIEVRGDRIATLGAARGGTEGREFAGGYVLPGLTDMHVHFPPGGLPGQTELFAFLFLYHGVTTVRDAGDPDGTATAPARDGVRAGRFPGPRVFACGPFVDGDPPLWKNSRVVRSAEDAHRIVGEIAAAGFDCVKAYTELSEPALAAVREAAHAHDLPVIGHTPMRVPYERARLDDVQHLIGVAPPLDDLSIRFPEIMLAWPRIDEARIAAILEQTLAHDMANTPTLVTSERLLGMEDYEALRRAADASLLPRFYADVVWSPTEGVPSLRTLDAEDFRLLRESLYPRLRVVRRLHEAGARLHLGSDVQNAFVVPGISLHREMRLFEQAGLTPEQVLAIGTRGPARALGDARHGRIAPGARADLLIFRTDPTRSLDALDDLVAVVADGRLYRREALDAQLARYQAWFGGRIYDRVATALVRRVLARLFDES